MSEKEKEPKNYANHVIVALIIVAIISCLMLVFKIN